MSILESPNAWMDRVIRHELVCSGDVQSEATANMLIFPLAQICSPVPNPEFLKRFLTDAFHVFSAKAVTIQFCGWFYAWHDEQSGTLRCSACRVGMSTDLPFSCGLEIVDTADGIARTASTSKYIHDVPASELEPAEFDDSDDPRDASSFSLTVFAKQLGPD